MVKLKNPRPVRLMDHSGRFDLKPGEEIEFESVPKDLMGLVKKGYLKEVKSSSGSSRSGSEKSGSSGGSLPAEDKTKKSKSQAEHVTKKSEPSGKSPDASSKKSESNSSVSTSSTIGPSISSTTDGRSKKDSKPSAQKPEPNTPVKGK